MLIKHGLFFSLQITADPPDINVLPEYGNDPRVVTNLIDGVYRTRYEMTTKFCTHRLSTFNWKKFNLKELRHGFLVLFVNPLSPESDQNQFSPDDFHTLSRD